MAELAFVPKTVPGFKIVKAETAVALFINVLRSILFIMFVNNLKRIKYTKKKNETYLNPGNNLLIVSYFLHAGKYELSGLFQTAWS
jgi:hypothetical protein